MLLHSTNQSYFMQPLLWNLFLNEYLKSHNFEHKHYFSIDFWLIYDTICFVIIYWGWKGVIMKSNLAMLLSVNLIAFTLITLTLLFATYAMFLAMRAI